MVQHVPSADQPGHDLLSNRLAVWIGLIIFPHWAAFAVCCPHLEWGSRGDPSVLCAAIALAWLTYRLIERLTGWDTTG